MGTVLDELFIASFACTAVFQIGREIAFALVRNEVCMLQAPPLALRSVLEGEIRAFASQQGVEGHRQCMRKFLELLLARGEMRCPHSLLMSTAHAITLPVVQKHAHAGRLSFSRCHYLELHVFAHSQWRARLCCIVRRMVPTCADM